MDDDAESADVAFPAAEGLVQRGVGEDLATFESQQRKNATVVNPVAPFVDDGRVGDAVFEQQALRFRDGAEEGVKLFFVRRVQRANRDGAPVFQRGLFRVMLQNFFQLHRLTSRVEDKAGRESKQAAKPPAVRWRVRQGQGRIWIL